MSALPTDAASRKAIPLASGLLDYFPDALIAVANLSLVANEQHNPGEPLHWSREKSSDHDDCLMRHFIERGTMDGDGILHRTKVAWRALAALQLESEHRKRLTVAGVMAEVVAVMQAPDLPPEVAAQIERDSDDNVGDLKAGEAHG